MNKTKLTIFIFALLSVVALLSMQFVSAAQSAVDLGTAGNFVILSKSGISTTGTTAIVGDIGVSPVAASYITGFGLVADSSNTFSTSSLLTGKVYAADYTAPTPIILTTAVSDMETAYTNVAGRTETSIVTELGAGDISGMTLAPGLYKWGTGVLINNGVTLSGGANEIWIFQIGEDLTVGNGAIVTLSGGAQSKNIFWQVAGQTTLGTTSDFKGIILCKTLIEIQTGATLNGRALAQTAVTLDANAVTTPSDAPVAPIVLPPVNTTDDSADGNNNDNNNNNNQGNGGTNNNIVNNSVNNSNNINNQTSNENANNQNSNNLSNMTFGKCVVEAAKLRQGCYTEDKNVSKQCADTAKSGKDKQAEKTCASEYKADKKICKVSFKEAKKTCVQTYKPGFWARMRYTFT